MQQNQLHLKKRCSKDLLYKAIINCAEDWVSLDYIAKSLDRDKNYLNNHIIPKMISDGLLERKFPLSPKNPEQKYRKCNSTENNT